jgi:antitoxin (DNA-binding transcriptional repressor) of toxin-antitoxin stability system
LKVEVQEGETVIILRGKQAVARLTAIDREKVRRPKVGTVTSAPVTASGDAFAPMSEDELENRGL